MEKELPVRKKIRLEGYDYSQAGHYHVTVCVEGGHEMLGKVVGDAVLCVPTVELTDIGEIVQAYLEKMNDVIKNAFLNNYTIMPNHIHLLVELNHGTQRTASPTKAVIPRIVHGLKSVVTKQIGYSIWQRSYHEHIIRNEKEYQHTWQYIDNNPAKWVEDDYFVKKVNPYFYGGSMEIRKTIEIDDFDAISRIYALSWKTAYKNIVPQQYLDELPENRWSDVLRNSSYDNFVMIKDGEYIGTSGVCPAKDEEMSGWGEIMSIYLLPEYFGKGYGKPLLDNSISALLNMGYDKIYLWVLEKNTMARRFYEKNGFSLSGKKLKTIGSRELTSVRYIYCP
jgi:GNAT superfamily N-acetyltransferase/REP element-mobilizing transposase RayT